MSHDVAHLRGLVDDLFLLARIEAGELTIDHEPSTSPSWPTRPSKRWNRSPGASTSSCGSRPTGSVPVLGGPEALGRVMRNLVDNAIRHAPTHSRVVVRVFNGDGATVEVIDDGSRLRPRPAPDRVRQLRAAPTPPATATPAAPASASPSPKASSKPTAAPSGPPPGPGGRVGFLLPTSHG